MSTRRTDQPKLRRYDPLSVLSYIVRYQQEHPDTSPSQRCIQRALTISAPSVVHNILRGLERRELLDILTYERGQSADLIVTEAGQLAVQQWRQQHPSSSETSTEQR